MTLPPARPTVLVYRNELLPISETFIRQQATALRHWQAVLIGRARLNNGLDLDGLRTGLVCDGSTLPRRLAWRAYTQFGAPRPAGLRRLLAERPALVHVHFGTDAVDAWPWLRHLGLPVVVTLHGYDVNIDPQWWREQPGHGPAERHMQRYPDKLRELAAQPNVSFIAVSKAIQRRAVSAYGIEPGKVEVLHIGVDHRAFQPGPRPAGERAPQVLFVGRLVEKKGPQVLIRAMQQVQAVLPQAELVLIGDGPLRSDSEQLARSLGVNARFMGPQPSHVVRRTLDETRVFCLPSITAANGDAEGMGIVLLEAQACGVPVVTSAVGGREEGILDGVTGFAFAEGDHQRLGERLVAMLTDDALASRMGAAARGFVAERFSLEACTDALERHYDRLLHRPPAPQPLVAGAARAAI